MNRSKKIIILAIIVLLNLVLCCLLNGWIYGFRWEKNKAEETAREYVKERYKLVPTEIAVIVSADGICGASVLTKELPFGIELVIDRRDLKVIGDLYLETLVEYHLEQFIREEISALQGSSKIEVVLQNRFSKDSTEFTIEKVNTNPAVILDMPEISYYCFIDGIEAGTEKSFLIFKQITNRFSPTSICFSRNDVDGENSTVCIYAKDFENVKNGNDIMRMGSY